MTKNLSDEQSIIKYLESYAPIKNYYVYQPGDRDTALIHFVDENGVSFSLMDDNEARVDLLLNFLEQQKANFISTVKQEEDFLKQLKLDV